MSYAQSASATVLCMKSSDTPSVVHLQLEPTIYRLESKDLTKSLALEVAFKPHVALVSYIMAGWTTPPGPDAECPSTECTERRSKTGIRAALHSLIDNPAIVNAASVIDAVNVGKARTVGAREALLGSKLGGCCRVYASDSLAMTVSQIVGVTCLVERGLCAKSWHLHFIYLLSGFRVLRS